MSFESGSPRLAGDFPSAFPRAFPLAAHPSAQDHPA